MDLETRATRLAELEAIISVPGYELTPDHEAEIDALCAANEYTPRDCSAAALVDHPYDAIREWACLSPEDRAAYEVEVQLIRHLARRSVMTQVELGRAFGCSKTRIGKIKRRECGRLADGMTFIPDLDLDMLGAALQRHDDAARAAEWAEYEAANVQATATYDAKHAAHRCSECETEIPYGLTCSTRCRQRKHRRVARERRNTAQL